MTKGKYLSDLYKSIENKSFNVDEAIRFIVDKKREKFILCIYNKKKMKKKMLVFYHFMIMMKKKKKK